MDDLEFNCFDKQGYFLSCNSRFKGAFAGKRGGKTEIGAIQSIIYQEENNNRLGRIDKYVGIIIAPTRDMLDRLSWEKFIAYAKPFIKDMKRTPHQIIWHNGSVIYGISADNPRRIEGIKAGWVWIDEVFQCNEDLYLECMARVADQQGFIICTGSLGRQIINPKQHWTYKYFKERPCLQTSCFEWATLDNPYFPKDEVERLRTVLDPITFGQMFEINWDSMAKLAVYDTFSTANIKKLEYNDQLETYISIDWGWTHPCACLFIQYDRQKDIVYVIDEIVESNLLLENLWKKIVAIKRIPEQNYICDISGLQTREQSGLSNIQEMQRIALHDGQKIKFRYRSAGIIYGISIVRSYILNAKNERRLFINERCIKLIDGIKRYSYKEKDGIIQNENPIDVLNDEVDALKFFFTNILPPELLFKKENKISYM